MNLTVAQLIKDGGGAATFAQKVGRTTNNVRVWQHRNRIPRDAWPEVLEAFPDVTMERLKALEAAA